MYGNTIGFDEPYLYGSAPTAINLVPALFDISIAGHGYKAETSFEPYRRDAYRSDSIQPVADRLDVENIPGESSINNEGLWRRDQYDWSHGSGQLYFDRHGSDSARFLSSKGINPWTQWYASLLPDVTQLRSSTTITQVISCAGYTYIVDGGNAYFAAAATPTVWTECTGPASGTITQIATDGTYVYVATSGSAGIYLGTIGTAAIAQWISGTLTSVWYVAGQVLCAHNNLLYAPFVSTGTAGPTAIGAAGTGGANALLFTQLSTGFQWTVAAAGNSWIYVGGQSSTASANLSYVYRTQITSSGTAMMPPVVANVLPAGETIYALFPYANYFMMGTNFGARLCTTLGVNDPGGNAGDLKVGPIVPNLVQQVTLPVRCFAGYFRWVWFGWSNYDTFSTGLGRADLSTFIDQQAPAYTSDLMVGTAAAPQQGEILSMDWFNGAPVFVVKGVGLYTQSTSLVASGTINTGYMTYGMSDNKIALLIHYNAIGTGYVYSTLTIDDGTYVQTTTPAAPNPYMELPLNQLYGEQIQIVTTLDTGAGAYDTINPYDSGNQYNGSALGPTLRRQTLKVLPAVVSGTQHKAIINLFSTEASVVGPNQHMDAYAEYVFLDNLRKLATPVQYIEGTQFNVTVVIKSLSRFIYSLRPLPEGGFNQRIEVLMQTLED